MGLSRQPGHVVIDVAEQCGSLLRFKRASITHVTAANWITAAANDLRG